MVARVTTHLRGFRMTPRSPSSRWHRARKYYYYLVHTNLIFTPRLGDRAIVGRDTAAIYALCLTLVFSGYLIRSSSLVGHLCIVVVPSLEQGAHYKSTAVVVCSREVGVTYPLYADRRPPNYDLVTAYPL